MRNLKKFLALVLALMMVVSVMVTVNAAATSTAAEDAAVKTLENYDVLHGYEDGLPHPEKDITRAQMAALVYRIMTGDTESDDDDVTEKFGSEATKRFADVASDDWYTGYIGWCANEGVLKGYPDKTVKPTVTISGNEVQAMLLRALGYDKNNEYSGDDWTYNVLSDSTLAGVNKGVTFDSSAKTRRGIVALLTVNAAINAKRVAPAVYPNIGYNTLEDSLIEVGTSEPTPDTWGAPSVTYTLTFTKPNTPVVTHPVVDEEALASFYDEETECDVAHEAGFTAVKKLTSWLDGNELKTSLSTVIRPTNTVSKIGQDGRWTRVYSDRVVYVDYWLGEIANAVPAVVDKNGHVITSASADIIVYKGGTTVKFSNVKIAQSYSNGDMVVVPIVAASVNGLYDYTIGGGKIVENEVYAVLTETVTVNSVINRQNDSNRQGFVGTNGKTYYYNRQGFSYNGGASITRLATTDIGKTFTVYTTKEGYVLGVDEVTASGDSGYGVLLSGEVVKLATKNYVLEFEVLLPNGTTTTLRGVGAANEKAGCYTLETGTGSAADALDRAFSAGKKLTTFKSIGNGLYSFNWALSYDITDTALKTGKVQPGTDSNLLVNEDTVFFVADYVFSNGKDMYVYDGIDIYDGFKAIPELKNTNTAKTIDPAATLTGKRNANTLVVYYFDDSGDGFADAALVLNAVAQSTQKAGEAKNYVYLPDVLGFEEIGDDYHAFRGIENGVETIVKVANAADNVTSNGLYTYTKTTNGLYEMTKVTSPAQTFTTGSASYAAGVISGLSTGKNYGVNDTDQHLTVADDCAVYLVNPSTFEITKTSLALINSAQWKGAAVYYQLDEYGYVDMIYIIDIDHDKTGPDSDPTTATVTFVLEIVDPDTGKVILTYKTVESGRTPGTIAPTLGGMLGKFPAVSGSNLTKYGSWKLNGVDQGGTSFTTVAGGEYTVTIQAYYLHG